MSAPDGSPDWTPRILDERTRLTSPVCAEPPVHRGTVRSGHARRRPGIPARRPRSGPADGRRDGARPVVHPGRSRHRQDARHHPPRRLRARDRGRPADRRPGRHLHRQGGDRDAVPAGRDGSARGGRIDVPCGGAPPASSLLAARPGRRPALDPVVQGVDPRAARRDPPGRLPISGGARPRGRDRVGQGQADRTSRLP